MKINVERFHPLLVGAAIGILSALGFYAGLLDSWDSRMLDLLFLPHRPDSRISIVAIDDASLTQIGRWPWPRSVHAEIVEKLKAAGATVIGYDVNFPEPSNDKDDGDLAAALKDAGNVVLPLELSMLVGRKSLTYDPQTVLQPIPLLGAAAKATGHVNSPPDMDNVFRRLPLAVKGKDASSIPSFESEILRLAGQENRLSEAPLDKLGRMRVNFSGPPNNPQGFRTISAANVLRGTADLSPLKGGIVLVGATAFDLHDNLLVPTSGGQPMSGIEIHANVLDTLLNRRWLRDVPDYLVVLYLVLLGLFLGFVVPHLRARYSLSAAAGLWAVTIVGAFVLFDRGWLFDVLWPSFCIIFAYAGVTLERRIASDRQRRKLKTAFSRYVSPAVVETIIADPSKLRLGGERKVMTVLFSDICGFTSISEKLSPDKLVEILNIYLSRMTAIVFEEHGVLDKYIGDAVMAFWNAPFEQPDHALRAVTTALKMQEVLDDMNAKKEFGEIEIRIGIGINTGDMVVGNVGGEARFDYTVIGDNVNLGSRLEGLTRQYKVGILVTEATRQACGERILMRRLDKVAVKGKHEPVMIYEAMTEAASPTASRREFAQAFERALDKYFAKDFAGCSADCDVLLKSFPADAPTIQLKERAGYFLQEPPPGDWDGTWVYTKK
jgi:adenylate cyclase